MEQLVAAAIPHMDGRWINERVSRVVEIIRDYDPNLEVCWIPPDKREPGDAAFAIVETGLDGRRSVAFYVQTEAEFDERVLARIFAGDTTKSNVLSSIEASEIAHKAMQMKKYLDRWEEEKDHIEHVIKSPLNKYVGKDGRVYRS